MGFNLRPCKLVGPTPTTAFVEKSHRFPRPGRANPQVSSGGCCLSPEETMWKPWRNIYHLVICYIAMERSTIFKNGKPSISMGHGFHGELLNNQMVCYFASGYISWICCWYILGVCFFMLFYIYHII